MTTPRVSVLMSVYNGEKHVRHAIDSILSQTFTDFEFIIVDDGSTDSTVTILDSYSDARIVRRKNSQRMGLARSLNRGLALARGEFVARQDADDVSLLERLATQVAFLDREPSVILLGTAIQWIDESGQLMNQIDCQPCTDASIRWKMLLNNSFYHSSVMARRSVLVNNGLWYDVKLEYAQDYELWSRVLAHGHGANLPVPLVQLRSHKDRITRVAWEAQQAAADQIAFANFERAGLDRFFSKAEIVMMRRSGDQGTPLLAEEVLAQARSLLKLFRHIGGNHKAPVGEWKVAQKEMLRQVRRHLAHWPRDMATFQTQLLVVRADPLGIAADVAGCLARLVRRAFLRHSHKNCA